MFSSSIARTVRRKAVWGPKSSFGFITLFALLAIASTAVNADAAKGKPARSGSHAKNYKLDDELTARSTRGNQQEKTSVIVTLVPGAQLPAPFKKFARGGRLDILNGEVLDLPNSVLRQLASHPDIFRVHYNRPVKTTNYRTAVTIGSLTARETYGYSGAGVGIAVIDSGIATWHDDLTNTSSTTYPYGNQRVRKFVDFVNGHTQPYDDNGHGTHVSGTILGNGYDSFGEKAGIAPGASLISLKVLDANGQGTISHIIAALNWIVANHQTYNIRVVNMSVGAGVYESYLTDPLTLATKAVVDRGITVVTAAGNLGKNAQGQLQYGGITAPGNAPWVLTVCASSTNGTLTRFDDTVASYSSAGPTAVDFGAKPDICAPGTGTVSLAVPGSTFYATKAQYLVQGKRLLGYKPYLSLSGTSMAAPVVSGSIALMLQADPTLTPNLIKAILQYTAQQYPGYHALRQGAGFLNTLGAVRLARFYANNHAGDYMPVQRVWSRQILWGNHRLKGGYLNPLGNAWGNGVTWGAAKTLGDTGDNIIWGTACGDSSCDNVIWGTDDANGDNVVWGTSGDDVVWGTADDGDNIIWGTSDDGDNIVWGTDCGGADCDNVIWGTADDGDNIIWGTAEEGDNIIWGTDDGDNIIWGTSSDVDVTWGADSVDAVMYPDDADLEPLPSILLEFGDIEVPAPPPSADGSTSGEPTGNTTIGGGF